MRRRTALSWNWLWLMFLLLGLLAFLQWRWTGEVSRAEKARLERALEQAAVRFEADFDREISRLFRWFQGRDADLGPAVEAWRREAPFGDILEAVLVLRRGSGELQLAQLDESAGELEPVVWSEELEPLRKLGQLRLAGNPGFRRRNVGLPISGIGPPLGGAPSLLVPGRRLLVLRLDRQAIAEALLAELTTTHFTELELGYDLLVTDSGRGSTIYATSSQLDLDSFGREPPIAVLFRARRFDLDPVRQRLARSTSDLFGDDRTNSRRGDIPRSRRGERDGGFLARRQLPSGTGAWLVFARHREGSLDAAVSELRLRNLAISLGILALLGGAGAFLIQSTRRAQALAQQQLDFVAGLTHELHTPLAAIESASANLADGVVQEPQKVRDYGSLIGREGRRLTQLVGQALELAGLRSGDRALDRAPVEIGELFEQVVADYRFQIEQRAIEVECQVEPDLSRALGDATALRRIVGNLLSNAIKYGAGPVDLRAERLRDENQQHRGRISEHRTKEPQNTSSRQPRDTSWIVLEVVDRGPGIETQDLGRLFEPYYRGVAARASTSPGSGLGLHLARELVSRQDGSLSAHNREGGGAVFRVVLPAEASQ